MPKFRRIELSDKEWAEPILRESGFKGSEYSFANAFIYRQIHRIEIAHMDEFVLIKSRTTSSEYSFLYPAGHGDMRHTVEALIAESESSKAEFSMHCVPLEGVKVLSVLFPDKFKYEEMRDNFDYIYKTEKLATLEGKKLHSKRNFVNRFLTLNDGNWAFENISKNNIAECWNMNKEWCAQNGCGEDPSLMEEACAVRKCFINFEALGLSGALLRLGKRIVAYTIGEALSSDTFIIHIEKAFSDVAGAYAMINQQFVKHCCANYQYVNREDDVGNEGLRKAKLSYKPDILLEKYHVTIL